jgi:hypothetical protein
MAAIFHSMCSYWSMSPHLGIGPEMHEYAVEPDVRYTPEFADNR